jgi:hypothetical protein
MFKYFGLITTKRNCIKIYSVTENKLKWDTIITQTSKSKESYHLRGKRILPSLYKVKKLK